jgi:small subunit ribosomal protein S3Ae
MAVDKAAAQEGAKKKVSRTATRKVKDKWKAKTWFNVRAPPMYNGAVIAETLTDETDKLIGRVAEATLQDLTGDFSKMHIKMRFKVQAVRGNECATKFAGHELTSDYIRRLTRRKHSKIDTVVDVTTKDGFSFRIKPMAVTERRAQSGQEGEIRRIAQRVIEQAATDHDHAQFIKEVVNGDLAQVIFRDARKVYPLKRVEIRKSEVVSEPQQYYETVDLFAAPPPEAAPEGAAAAPAAEGEAATPAPEAEPAPAPASEPTEEERL